MSGRKPSCWIWCGAVLRAAGGYEGGEVRKAEGVFPLFALNIGIRGKEQAKSDKWKSFPVFCLNIVISRKYRNLLYSQ